MTEAGIGVFEGIDSNEMRVATTKQVIMKMLDFCEKVIIEKKCTPQYLVLDFPLSLLGFSEVDTDDPPGVQEEVLPP